MDMDMDMDMGRHTIINPATGRSILKTGALGRLVQKMQKQMKAKSGAKPKSPKTKKTLAKKTLAKKTSYHHATKRACPFKKRSKQGGTLPSARANYDKGNAHPVHYKGKVYVMAFRCNGSPYYRPKAAPSTP